MLATIILIVLFHSNNILTFGFSIVTVSVFNLLNGGARQRSRKTCCLGVGLKMSDFIRTMIKSMYMKLDHIYIDDNPTLLFLQISN